MSTKRFVNFINKKRKANKKYEKCRIEVQAACERIENRIEKKFSPFGVNLNVMLDTGRLISSWDPIITIYSHCNHEKKQFFCKIEGKWRWYNGFDPYRGAYPHLILDDQDAPFDIEALERACRELQEELDIPVNIADAPILKEVKHPECIDDLLFLLPGAEILAEGYIEYMGWDCTNQWAVLKDKDNKLHVFYGKTANGDGYNIHLTEEEGFHQFLAEIREDRTSADVPESILTILTKG